MVLEDQTQVRGVVSGPHACKFARQTDIVCKSIYMQAPVAFAADCSWHSGYRLVPLFELASLKPFVP